MATTTGSIFGNEAQSDYLQESMSINDLISGVDQGLYGYNEIALMLTELGEEEMAADFWNIGAGERDATGVIEGYGDHVIDMSSIYGTGGQAVDADIDYGTFDFSQLPDPFSGYSGYDFDEFLENRQTAQEVEESIQIPGLEEAIASAAEMATGAIPDDVAEAVVSRSAESAFNRGFGAGSGGQQIIDRNLAGSSVQISQMGAQQLATLGSVQTEVNKLAENARARDDNMSKIVADVALKVRDQDLGLIELYSQSSDSFMDMYTTLVVENSKKPILGVNENLETLQNYMDPTQLLIMQQLGYDVSGA